MNIEALTEEVGNRLGPFEAQVAILTSVPGSLRSPPR